MTVALVTTNQDYVQWDVEWTLGDDIVLELNWKEGPTDLSLQTVDFSGCVGVCQIKSEALGAALDSFDVTLDSTSPNIRMGLPKVRCAALKAGKFKFDLQITDTAGKDRTYVKGTLKLVQDVTRL